jgi:hypothetical protein
LEHFDRQRQPRKMFDTRDDYYLNFCFIFGKETPAQISLVCPYDKKNETKFTEISQYSQ